MPIRTWGCLNRWCRHEFDSGVEGLPPCPRCGGRVKWIPKSIAVKSERTAQIDRDVASVRALYPDNRDWNSPRRGEPMAKRPAASRTLPYSPVAGWSMNLPFDAKGQPLAWCAPANITASLTAPIDKPYRSRANIGGQVLTQPKPTLVKPPHRA